MQLHEALHYACYVLIGAGIVTCAASKALGIRRTLTAAAILLALGGLAVAARSHLSDRIGAPRLAVLEAMEARPHDPWPRGSGHVPLGPRGAAETEKGYMEPGGSFSPAAGTFGISFWIVGDDGALIATSDSIPLDQTRARYVTISSGGIGISVTTPFYDATWTVEAGRGFELMLAPHAAPGQHVEVAIRGVGPAGGALTEIEREGDHLRLGSHWTMGPLDAHMPLTYFGQEGGLDWMRPGASEVKTVRSASGWAHARFAVPREPVTLSLIRDTPTASDHWPTEDRPKLEGADSRFTDSLLSQIATLQLGLVGDQTRPGDPLNYPLEWLRDGAYAVVALARSGQTRLAERLALGFARKDFFGGFGAEGDAPGLALWTLAETSALVRRIEFDRAIWPDVQRKAALILLMAKATSEVRHDFAGPVTPQRYTRRRQLTLVAEPARDGLIAGRMDWQRPVFFVTAVSYAGLTGAARIADELGEAATAAHWRRGAAELRAAYVAAFGNPDFDRLAMNDRTAISGLWPSEIAPVQPFARLMERRWQKQEIDWSTPSYRPRWTYFVVAEAHQWLRLGRVERVWTVLERLWDRQPAPGLYTLWEGNGPDGGLSRWKFFRGWVAPHGVTPHYWSAAELLLLQLAMLAETRGEPGAEQLVIGGGIPTDWLSRDLAFSGIGTARGFVDWTWDGEQVSVTVRGAEMPVELGPSFPSSARLNVKFLDHDPS
jgi:hypothetical protein